MLTILIYGKIGIKSFQNRYNTIFKERLIRKVKVSNNAKIDSYWMREIEPRGVRYEIVKSY